MEEHGRDRLEIQKTQINQFIIIFIILQSKQENILNQLLLF